MIEIEKLTKNYGKKEALKGVDLTVPTGNLFAYLGPNGAGKSTTIRILTGLTVKSGGTARLGGHDIEAEPLAAKRQFGVVHQYINLDQELTVFENLDIHGQLFGMSRNHRRSRIADLLDYIDMAGRADHLASRLSGGLKRRVTIARALLHQPSILFLDEPTVGLDAAIRRKIWALIKKIQQQGTTIFLTTHHIEEAEFLAGQALSPLLYLLTFGYAMGSELRFDDVSYLQFLLPGLVAMASMTQAFGIATDINVARFYWHIFDEFQAAPISNFSYVAGEVAAGMTRALLAVVIIIGLGLLFGQRLAMGPVFWLAILLNSFLFASLAVALAMLVKSHADQSLLTSFVINPMAFLGGTFFPLDRLPGWVQAILNLLPLSHASTTIRAAALGREIHLYSLALLASLGAFCFWIALNCVNKARN